MGWTVQGIIAYIQGAKLPYATANWYWLPSRAIPTPGETEPITEFPFFTILYSDLHAHLIALPITLLILGWIVSVIVRSGRWGDENGRHQRLGGVLGFLVGGLAIGALRPTNTWDFYTYLLLGGLAFLYATLRRVSPGSGTSAFFSDLNRKVLWGAAGIAVLVGLSFVLYQPFSEWYRQGYNSVDVWEGLRTPFWSYLTHWGLFLFAIVSWMVWETHAWLASTPMSSLKKLRPYRGIIQAGLVVALAGILALALVKVQIGWVVILIGAWAALLMFRPGLPDTKRLALFLVGSGLVLTLFVELFVLRGDIGRMNTVFKFYLQVWTFLSIAAAVSLGWILEGLDDWSPKWFPTWSLVLTGLVLSAALFPLMGGMAKIRDRMVPNVPATLDAMSFMNYAHYVDTWGDMDLSQDYRAIRWLQEHVSGSPVIVEANLRQLYRWGSRMTVYTGLPGVVGWEWHQQQQRVAVPPGWVTDRIFEIEAFYRTTEEAEARAFLEKYNVGYIIVGQQERGMYPGAGLDKFPQLNGILWQEVYRDDDTVIYQSACACSPF
jgi:YYY domain-containing protein